jgi:hypothetical protein
MALKPDRVTIDTSIDYFMNQTANRGGVVSVLTAGSGAAMDQSVQAVHYDTSPSGATPVGILLSEVVNLDLTRQHENWHKEERQQGGKVTILVKGQVTTDHLASGITVTAGQGAYLGAEGRITNVNTGAAASPKIGTFHSTINELGFAKVSVNLP